MEKSLFKFLSASYKLESKYIEKNEEYYTSQYTCIYKANAIFDEDSGYYNYRISRSDVLIDNKSISKLMDKIILEIGNAIYPISLLVNQQMRIIDVVNYEDIKQKWINNAKEKLDRYPSSEIKRYLSASYKNIKNKNTFINCLYKDSFLNLYFRNIFEPTIKNEVHSIVWHNFPKKQMNQTYLYEIAPMKENQIKILGEIMQIVPEQNGTYAADYRIGNEGQIISISGSIESKHQDKLYKKQVSIQSTDTKISTSVPENIIL